MGFIDQAKSAAGAAQGAAQKAQGAVQTAQGAVHQVQGVVRRIQGMVHGIPGFEAVLSALGALGSAPFQPARAKLVIGSLDVPSLEVSAQYNPKELGIDKTINWDDLKARNNQQSQGQNGSPNTEKSPQSDLGFNGTAPRSMTIEFLFDGYETNTSVEEDIHVLEEMSSVQGPEVPASQEDKRRPHHCVVVWGSGGMQPFRCVIETLQVKYQMWNTDGVPVRATCTVKLKEARKMAGSRDRIPSAQSRGPNYYRVDNRTAKW